MILIQVKQFTHSSQSATGDLGGLRDHIPPPGHRKPSHISLALFDQWDENLLALTHTVKSALALSPPDMDFRIAYYLPMYHGIKREKWAEARASEKHAGNQRLGETIRLPQRYTNKLK